jgi:hypothetical protein
MGSTVVACAAFAGGGGQGVSASKPAMPEMTTMMSNSSPGDFGDRTCTWCLSVLTTDAKGLYLDSTTLLGKEHGELPAAFMVCGSDCKKKYSSPSRRSGKKQQGIIKRLYSDLMRTNVRVGDTVQVHGDISDGRYVEGFGWGLVERVRYNWTHRCAEISVKVLDTTVLVWPAGVRRIDAKENEGRPLRQRGGGGGVLVERDRNAAQLEQLVVKCDSQTKRAAGSEAAIKASARMVTELEEARAVARRESERADAEAGAFIYKECTSESP